MYSPKRKTFDKTCLFQGSTISCFGPDGVPEGLLNTYCWIMSTFRLAFPQKDIVEICPNCIFCGIFSRSVCLQRARVGWGSPWTWSGDGGGDGARLLSVGSLCPLPPGASHRQTNQNCLQTKFLPRASCSTFLTTCGKPLSTRRLTRSRLVCAAKRLQTTLIQDEIPSRISSTIFGRPGALTSPMHSSKDESHDICKC